MDDVRGHFLGPPHGTSPAATVANKDIEICLFQSNGHTHRQSVCHIAQYKPQHIVKLGKQKEEHKFCENR